MAGGAPDLDARAVQRGYGRRRGRTLLPPILVAAALLAALAKDGSGSQGEYWANRVVEEVGPVSGEGYDDNTT